MKNYIPTTQDILTPRIIAAEIRGLIITTLEVAGYSQAAILDRIPDSSINTVKDHLAALRSVLVEFLPAYKNNVTYIDGKAIISLYENRLSEYRTLNITEWLYAIELVDKSISSDRNGIFLTPRGTQAKLKGKL